MDFDSQWVEIFRVGDYGAKGEFTAADLDAMVANLAHWKPPLVLGHPDTDSPAMGWAAEFKREGDRLLMRAENVQPELRAHVASGRFPNRSIALYTNPKGTGPAVRHIGFLGATPPEVKGLAPIRFSSSQFVEIEFKERQMEKSKLVTMAEEAVAKMGKDAVFFDGNRHTPINAQSVIFAEAVKQRVSQMRMEGRREEEHVLMAEAMTELRKEF
jgi:hypothetical protein